MLTNTRIIIYENTPAPRARAMPISPLLVEVNWRSWKHEAGLRFFFCLRLGGGHAFRRRKGDHIYSEVFDTWLACPECVYFVEVLNLFYHLVECA